MEEAEVPEEYTEKKVALVAYRIRRICKCGAEFRFTHSRTGIIDKYYHRCSECGKETWFDSIYPIIRHEEV